MAKRKPTREFEDREAALSAAGCDDITRPLPVGDVDPVPVAPDCDPLDAPKHVFVPPAAPQIPTTPRRRLPAGVVVGNPEISETCPAGTSPALTETVQPHVIPAGTHSASVYLDDLRIDGIKLSLEELYRIAPLIPDLQAFADTRLREADVDVEEVTTEVLLRLSVTPVVAAAIAEELLATQGTVTTMAHTEAQTALSCVYWNVEMWVVCHEITGWHAHLEAPADGAKPEPFVHVPAGVKGSPVSQDAANESAARAYAGELPCVYPNDEQSVSCLDIDSEAYDVSIPVDTDTPVHLSTLDGRVFDTADTLVVGAGGRALTFYSTVASGEYFASDTAAANALARTAAILALDCFLPSKAVTISCVDTIDDAATYNPAVLVRQLAKDYTDEEILNELVTGRPERDRNADEETWYYPDNVGVVDGALDTRAAVRVALPAGLFVDSLDQQAANAEALTHAQSLIDCVWTSPEHRCRCLSGGDPTIDSAPYVSRLNGLVTEYGVNANPAIPHGAGVAAVNNDWIQAIHVTPSTAPSNVEVFTIAQGAYVSSEIPTADPVGDPDGPLWPQLAAICGGSLSCEFKACSVVFCEPRPDNRLNMSNGEPNWISWDFDSTRGEGGAAEQYLLSLSTVMMTEFSNPDLCSHIGWMADCAMDYNNRNYMELTGGGEQFAEIGDKLTGGWFTKAQLPEPTGTPPVFVNGGILSSTQQAWASNCGEAGTRVIPPVTETLGFFSGACGCYYETNPGDLWGVVMAGKNDAMSRLDCTHTAWERTIHRCPVPSHVAGKTGITYEDRPQADSTELANITTEEAIIAEMDCQAATGGQLGAAGNSAQVGNFTAQNVGPDECEPVGKKEVQLMVQGPGGLVPLTKDSDILNGFQDNEVRHYTVVGKCAPMVGGGEAFQFILEMRSSPALEEISEIWDMTEGGKRVTVMPECVASQPGAGGSGSWYIGSIVHRSDNVTGNKPVTRILQYHVGPLIVTKTCCDDSSSSSSSDSESSESESSESESSSDSGSSDSGASDSGGSFDSGSDKSTAIIPISSSPTGYRAMFTIESNRVLFEFPMCDIEIVGRETVVPIHPDWVEACAPNSLRVLEAPCGDRPFPVSAYVDGAFVVIRAWPTSLLRPTRVNLRLTGIRKGHAKKDMPTRTRAQFVANEAFINSAYGPT